MQPERVSRRAVLAASAGLVATGVGAAGGDDHGTDRTGDDETDRNHLVVAGGSPGDPVEYQFVVTGDVRRNGRAGDAPLADSCVTVDTGDSVSADGERRSVASGTVAGGADAYIFTGRITRFRIELVRRRLDAVRIFLNGRRVSPAELGDNPAAATPVEFLDCNTAVVVGDFDGVELNASFWDEGGLGTSILFPDPVSGVTTLHPAEQFDPFPFTIESLGLDPDPIPTPGAPAQFTAENPFAGPWCEREENQFPNHLLVAGEGGPGTTADYEFAVSGSVRKSDDAGDAPVAGRRVSVDAHDRITDSRVTGTVYGGADAYRYSGEITEFGLDGPAQVFLDGERVRPADLGTPTPPPRPSVEFTDCDRAVVRGDFGAVAVDTVWFASDGFATSFTVLGPVSGRTVVDRSNAGDIADVSGFVITRITAGAELGAEPTLNVRNPNLEECIQSIRPEPIRPFAVDCGPGDGGGEVVFGYENPNDAALLVPSELVGNATDDPPTTLDPGRNAFTVGWQPASPDERLTWRLDLTPFSISERPAATTPTATDCGIR
ncbi:hypothetical protein [Halomicrococcus gelatinilyticus]|uniref:hypothetical protein n=1 Tax=Halomicrococcus gelatinilyticus TaxID=1702103 RepID=UPI002E0D0F9D